jgi:hypothetical protein
VMHDQRAKAARRGPLFSLCVGQDPRHAAQAKGLSGFAFRGGPSKAYDKAALHLVDSWRTPQSYCDKCNQ